jgi:uncharacterized metal-binding protein
MIRPAAPPKPQVAPFLDETPHGLFAVRAPCRPNPIGISAVRLLGIDGNVLRVADIDVLDGTPLLDIKPYVPRFDSFPRNRHGWVERTAIQRKVADERFDNRAIGPTSPPSCGSDPAAGHRNGKEPTMAELSEQARRRGGRSVLLYACSGAANVAEAADRACRTLMREGSGSMFCLAGLGAGIGGMIQTAKDAELNVVVDGCDMDCGRKILDRCGARNYVQIKVTDLDIEKAKDKAATEEEVAVVVNRVRREVK